VIDVSESHNNNKIYTSQHKIREQNFLFFVDHRFLLICYKICYF